MRALIVPMLVLTMFAAGCTSDAPTTSPTPTNNGNQTGPTTNVIHFLAPPKTTLEAPTGTAQETMISTFSPVASQGASAEWSYKFTAKNATTITNAEATLYIRAKEPTAHMGGEVGGNGFCTWKLDIVIGSQPPLIGRGGECGVAPPGPITGDVTAKFTIAREFEIPQGAVVKFQFTVFTSSQDERPTLAVVTGAPTFDSHIVLEGAKEPLAGTNPTPSGSPSSGNQTHAPAPA